MAPAAFLRPLAGISGHGRCPGTGIVLDDTGNRLDGAEDRKDGKIKKIAVPYQALAAGLGGGIMER